ncbi:MAG: hypothetical protein ACE5EB_01345 [Thermodesulfobacteriota bacterium]
MKRRLLTGLLVLTAALFIKADISSSATGTQGVAGTVAAYTNGLAANGIVGTRHNMGAFGGPIRTNATTQVCVFCHTPHHTNQSAAPLWNRSTANSTSYQAYGSTIGGSNITTVDGGASIACLSCHDGVTTFDSIVNAPGNGGITAGGSDQQWSFIMADVGLDLGAWDHFGTPGNENVWCTACHGTGGFAQGPNTWQRLSIGTDLTNDHPVSVTYSGNTKASLRAKTTVLGTIDLTTGLSNTNSLSAYYQAMTQNRWAVNGSISDTANISALLRNDKVECSSCHDPHFKNLSWDEADASYDANYTIGGASKWCSGDACIDGLFLRRVGGNTGSGVCRTCHDK